MIVPGRCNGNEKTWPSRSLGPGARRGLQHRPPLPLPQRAGPAGRDHRPAEGRRRFSGGGGDV